VVVEIARLAADVPLPTAERDLIAAALTRLIGRHFRVESH